MDQVVLADSHFALGELDQPRLAIRGVAGAHLYEVSVDGEPLAFLEDRQDKPTYVHNSVVREGSEVVVVPLGYGQHRQRGTASQPLVCPT